MNNEQRVTMALGGLAGVMCMALLLVGTTESVHAAPGAAAVQAGAQAGQAGPGRPGGRGGFGRGPRDGINAANLTDAQRDQIRTVRTQHREEIRKLTTQVRTARQALQAATRQGQVDEARATELGNATAALAVAQARVQSEVLAVLTPEQKQQIQTRREEMRKWMESRPGRGTGARGERRGR